MADPLTAIGALASVASIIDVLGKSINTIRNLRSQYDDADLNLVNFVAQLTALRAALTKIKGWSEHEFNDPYHQLVMDLDASVDCCALLVRTLDDRLSALRRKNTGGLKSTAKMKLAIGAYDIENMQKMIQRQAEALNLLLTACNW